MNTPTFKILIIDDRAEDRASLRHFLQPDSGEFAYSFLEEESGEAGVKTCLEKKPDCVLLDHELPDTDGLAILKKLNPDLLNPLFPIILLTGASDAALAVNAFKSGAQDYLVKGKITADELCRSVRRAIEIISLQRKRRQAEDALSASQAHFSTIFAQAASGLSEISLDGRFLRVNDQLCQMLGRSREELLTLSVPDVTFAEDVPNSLAALQGLIETGEPTSLDKRYVHSDGKIVYAHSKLSLLAADPSQPRTILAVTVDLTAHKAAEEKMRLSEELLKLGVEVTDFAICEIDYATGTIHLSQEAARLYGLGDAEMTVPREAVHATFHPDEAAELAQIIAECLNPDGAGWFAREHRIVRKKGEVRWLNVRKQIFFDRTASPPRAVRGILAARDITERKLAEVSRAQLAAIVESAADAIYVYDFDGTILNWNKSAEALYGYAAAEIVGQPITTLMSPELAHQPEDIIAAIQTGEPVVSLETRRRRKDGTQFAALLTASPIKDAAGRHQAVSVIAQDITERIKAEEQLRESKDHLDALVNQTISGIVECDLTGRFTFVNDRFCEIVGYTREELVGKMGMPEITHPEDLPKSLKNFRRLAKKGINFSIEKRYLRKDGSIVWVANSVSALRDANGKPQSIVAVIVDITIRKQAEMESDKLISIVESTDDAIVSKDFNGTILSWNSGAERTFGYTAAEAIGQNISILFPPDRLAEEIEVIKTIKRGERISHYETVRKRKDGTTFPISLTVSPVKNAKGEIVGISKIARDITERKRAEHQLNEHEQRMRLATETTGVGLWEWNVSTNKIRWDAQMFRIYGRAPTPDGILPYSAWSECVLPEELLHQEELLQETVRQGGHGTREFRIRRNDDGQVRYIHAVETVRTNANGQTEWVLGTNLDITERKKAEEELRTSEEFNRTVLENSPDCVKILDKTGRLEYLNANGMCLLEIDDFEPFKNKFWWDLWTAETQPIVKESVAKALRGETAQFQAFTPTVKGTPKWWDVIVSPIPGVDGKIERIISVSRDITERREAEEQVRESEAQLRRVLDNLFAFVGILLPDGTLTDANRVPLEAAGISISDVVGKKFWDCYWWNFSKKTQAQLRDSVERAARGEVLRYDVQVRMAGGVMVWIDFQLAPLRDGTGRITHLIPSGMDITERKAAEAEIKALSDYNRTVLESIADPLFTLDREWRFTYMSRQGEQVVMREPDELLGKVLWEEFPGLIGSPFENLYRQAMNERRAGRITDFFPDHQRWYEVNIFPAPTGVTVYFRNVTERIQRERNLAFLADLSKDFMPLSSADEIMKMTGARIAEHLKLAHCSFVEINETADAALIIYDHHKPGSKNLAGHYRLTEFLDDESERRHLAAGKTLVVNDVRDEPRSPGAAAKFEALGIRALLNAPYVSDGRWKFALSIHHSQPHQWRSDEIELVQELAARIYLRLERARAEENLRESEERYRALFDSIDEGFCIIELLFDADEKPIDYRFIQANPAMERLTGLTNPIGKTMRELVPELEEFWFETYGKVALTGEAVRFENKSETMNRWFDVHASRVGNESNRRVAIVFNNITERKQIEQEREKMLAREQILRREAEDANRAKDEFLAVLSHELRTPLNSIKGWVSMLQNQNIDEAKRRRAIEVIARNVNSQNALIEDILDVSRIISGKMRLETERLSFVYVLQNVIEMMRPIAEARGINLQTDLDPSADEIEGDAFRLQQIIGNLLNNAIKFTPEGGAINVMLVREGETARLTVADTGIGIAPELLPRIFDRFQQADGTSKRKYNGLGLGLAIVKHLAELHGGAASAMSAGDGKGAAFMIELPLISRTFFPFGEMNDMLQKDEVSGETVLAGVKLLVVDDDADMRELMRAVLENCGADAVCVNSAGSALEKLAAERFDLLISDVGMAEMDGYDLIRAIRQNLDANDLPAIALSGYVSADDREKSISAGFQTHLGKPVNIQTLPSIILSLLNR